MPMPARLPAKANWASVITTVMDPFFAQAATIQIIDPKTSTTTPYNPVTNSGGVPIQLVIWSSKSIIQRVRRLTPGSNQSGWTTTQHFTFQIPASAPSILVRKGMRIRVISGGGDPALTELGFVVTVGLSGSLAPVRLMEAMAEMTSVFPHV